MEVYMDFATMTLGKYNSVLTDESIKKLLNIPLDNPYNAELLDNLIPKFREEILYGQLEVIKNVAHEMRLEDYFRENEILKEKMRLFEILKEREGELAVEENVLENIQRLQRDLRGLEDITKMFENT